MEVWKPIEEFKGLYEISNFGNVRSVDRYIEYSNGYSRFYKGKLKKTKLATNKYVLVGLNKDKKEYTRLVHRFVAKAFIDNPYNKHCVNHIDGNKLNNHVDNLEWCTHSENNTHAVQTGLKPIGSKSYNSKLTEKDVIAIRRLARVREQKEIAEAYGVSRSCICTIVSRQKWKHVT